jgi:predicted site-specific integrase-resolvase
MPDPAAVARMVTQREAARKIGVSEQTLRRWRRKGVLKGVYRAAAGSCRTVRYDLQETLAGMRERRARI